MVVHEKYQQHLQYFFQHHKITEKQLTIHCPFFRSKYFLVFAYLVFIFLDEFVFILSLSFMLMGVLYLKPVVFHN